MSIYTPRSCIDTLVSNAHACLNGLDALRNPQTCTKVVMGEYEISIAMDSSHGDGDLFRSDIRVFQNGKDVSDKFLINDEKMLYGDAETLFRVMKGIKAGA